MDVPDVAGKPLEFALICPACLHKNQARQRFCGLSGFPLKMRDPVAQKATEATPEPSIVYRSENDWQWLREKHLQELVDRQKRISRWMTLAIVLLLLALANGALLFWRNRSEFDVSWLPGSSAVSAPKPETVPVLVEQPNHPDLSSAQDGPAPESHSGTEISEGPGSPTAAESTAASGSGRALKDGTPELLQGRRYLIGRGVPKNSAVAAVWLWKAVARKNVDAVLLLSDLYVRGDGVPQSCDQARLLLTAAAQKGSAQARNRLHELPRSECR